MVTGHWTVDIGHWTGVYSGNIQYAIRTWLRRSASSSWSKCASKACGEYTSGQVGRGWPTVNLTPRGSVIKLDTTPGTPSSHSSQLWHFGGTVSTASRQNGVVGSLLCGNRDCCSSAKFRIVTELRHFLSRGCRLFSLDCIDELTIEEIPNVWCSVSPPRATSKLFEVCRRPVSVGSVA